MVIYSPGCRWLVGRTVVIVVDCSDLSSTVLAIVLVIAIAEAAGIAVD